MPIIPTKITGAGVQVEHEGTGHAGTVPWTGVRFDPARPLFAALPCPEPGCGSESLHPIGGGSAPVRVQRMFAHLLKRQVGGRTWAQAKDLMAPLVEAMDGPGRFRLADAEEGE